MKGANMNDNPKAASTQESIASHLNFADITDPAEREQLLMEELRRTQNALSKAKDEISRKQRALAERAFEQEAADARDLLHAACWTADFDDEGNPTGFWFSDECRRVLGYETEEGLPGNGGSSDRFIAPDDLARINSEFRIAATEGGPYDVNYCVRRKDGKRMWVRAAAKFRRDDQGIARSCMGVFVDIDDAVKNQARQQQALERALERADRANKVKTDFLHRMSHDMRTPLNSILGLCRFANAIATTRSCCAKATRRYGRRPGICFRLSTIRCRPANLGKASSSLCASRLTWLVCRPMSPTSCSCPPPMRV